MEVLQFAKKKSRRINETLIELLLGIGLYGLVGVILILLLISDEGRTLRGFLTGIVVSSGMVIHMYLELEKALYMGEAGAMKHTRMTTAFRMIAVVVIMVIVGLAKEDVIAAFVGLMALKVSAYIQPLTHKCFNKIKGKGR